MSNLPTVIFPNLSYFLIAPILINFWVTLVNKMQKNGTTLLLVPIHTNKLRMDQMPNYYFSLKDKTIGGPGVEWARSVIG